MSIIRFGRTALFSLHGRHRLPWQDSLIQSSRQAQASISFSGRKWCSMAVKKVTSMKLELKMSFEYSVVEEIEPS